MTSVPDSSLEAGLAALKRGDYPNAIARLEAVCQTQTNQSAKIRAQMGLVVAYSRSGELNRAIALCQVLSKHTDPQVREWATRNRAELTRSPVNQEVSTASPEADLTGFVPFDSSPSIETGVVEEQRSRRTHGATGGTPKAKLPPTALPRKNTPALSANSQASATTPSPHLPIPPSLHPPQWRQAERAKRWQPLKSVSLIPLWLLQAGTLVLLFWVTRELLKFAMALTNNLLVKLPYLEPIQLFYRDPTQFILLTLLLLIGGAPWLLDRILRQFYGSQTLSTNTLATYSPEAVRVLQRYCRQRGWHHPTLGILPTAAPVALTYGNLPRTARIVISQGLLEQLADDEIAALYAGQLGHIAHWDFVVMSSVTLVSQLFYLVYRYVSHEGNQVAPILRGAAALIASLAYGVWCLLSGTALWLSQLRIYYSDRLAAEITGNPNGLTRALLKITIGITKDIQQQGCCSWLLESWNLLTPVSYQQAVSLGSMEPPTSFESALAWDCLNPYRYWLTVNNTHPLMGDRLQRLADYAHGWKLEAELIPSDLVQDQISRKGAKAQRSPVRLVGVAPKASLRWQSMRQNLKPLLQAAPFIGIPLGLALAGLVWLCWEIGLMLEIWHLKWIYDDWSFVEGCLFIGFSLGTFMRINAFFPDFKPGTMQVDPSLTDLLADSTTLPVDSQPIRLQGRLLGRHGISNWLGQDLILHSSTGLIKLHHVSWLGPIGNFLPRQSLRPSDLVGHHLLVTGWFRRGATPSIDIDTLKIQSGTTSLSSHPLWSTLLGGAAAVWGAYIIFSGT